MGSAKNGSSVIGADRDLPDPEKISHNAKAFDGEVDIAIERPSRKLQGRREKLQKHWRRFWCCYLVAAFIFLAIALPIFFLVIIPAIAQRIVDNTSLPIYSAEILNPTADTVSFTLHTSLTVPAGLQIRTSAFNLSLFNRGVEPYEPYLTVGLPSYSLKGHTDMIITHNNTFILNQAQFVETLSQAVYNERFTMSAKGKTVGHLGVIKAPVTLNKNIELAGLDKLNGFSIDTAQLLIREEADGTNLLGTATLPNKSLFTFALGNVTLNLRSSELLVGQATITDVLLKPGNNSVSMRGTLDIPTIIDNIAGIISSQQTALLQGKLQLSASGNSTIYDGVHISYYEEVLNNLTITTQVPILEVLSGTLQNLVSTDNNSTLANIVKNITSILGDISDSTDFKTVARSLQALV
ncbi:hypothetical protein N7466_003635 [Penicillium verhagenii]|uniref:uncharacterized protein n=1 Tax=Penicillium verhagenii TaxID=1562060 RepID=UPI0025451118|nr:uncharacterized protein N7466_003635 [Penicillium verhagenii]KAJ5934088.1 hypothetical protein N7466_003635 [Penicillium verhagenii]